MNLMKKALPILRRQINLAREEGLTEINGIALPSPSLSNKQVNDALLAIQEEGWTKKMKRYNRLIYASSHADFDTAWAQFQSIYEVPLFDDLLTYIQKEWIDSCPENFRRFYTDYYLHLGEAANSLNADDSGMLRSTVHYSKVLHVIN
ncbi:hypothetical protein N7448_010977 [Penicillium atrosanguineum]|nr:hypothetical protein N7448_010977 [Penicillium atrosanguineum]